MTDRFLPHDAALMRLSALHPKRIDLTLNRVLRVCEALGNPQDKLPLVVHVAGTNAKGSVIAYLRAMAQAQGVRVHAYTSPHLVRFNERIRLNGALISDEYLEQCLNRVEVANAGAPLTFFEATTAAAFLAFSETPADLLLLETGLGGILDATNIINKPRLCIITPIDYDHQGFLGHDLTTIAKQKAGIIKTGVSCLSARQDGEVEAVLTRQAMKQRAPLLSMGQEFDAYVENERLIFQDDIALYDLPLPNLAGAHQIENAGLAIKAGLELGFGVAAIDQGLQSANWPARLQSLKTGPLYDALPKDSELWLDGGHNPHAARALRAHLDHLSLRDPKPTLIICGLLNTKDAPEFFQSLKGLKAQIACVGFNAENATNPEILVAAADDCGLSATIAPSPLAAIKALPYTPHRVLICGSLYLCGEVLANAEDSWPN